MKLSCTPITLHPEAKEFLYVHLRVLRRLFHDALGHLEVDYMAVALLNADNQMLFLSSKPGIECNLINYNLWHLDACLAADFFLAGKAQLWETLYAEGLYKKLRQYKLEVPGFNMGISIPSRVNDHRVVYSFASKSNDEDVKNKLIHEVDTLLSMGQFCLRKIINAILLPEQYSDFFVTKPALKLVIK